MSIFSFVWHDKEYSVSRLLSVKYTMLSLLLLQNLILHATVRFRLFLIGLGVNFALYSDSLDFLSLWDMIVRVSLSDLVIQLSSLIEAVVFLRILNDSHYFIAHRALAYFMRVTNSPPYFLNLMVVFCRNAHSLPLSRWNVGFLVIVLYFLCHFFENAIILKWPAKKNYSSVISKV